MVAQRLTAAEILDAVRAFAPRINEAGPRIEAERRIPRDIVDRLSEIGVFKVLVPRSMGGAEIALPEYGPIMETIARADGSTAWCCSQGATAALVSGFLPGAAEIFNDPGVIIASGAGTPGTATETDGGWRVTGRWPFGSGSRHATWLAGGCVMQRADGSTILRDNGQPQTCTAYFPQAEAEFEDIWHVSGLRGTASDLYAVTDKFVRPDRIALMPYDDPIEPGPLYRVPAVGFTPVHAIGFSHVAIGLAGAMHDAFVDLAMTKIPRGVTGVLRDNAVIQSRVAENEATLRSCRVYLRQTVEAAWDCILSQGRLAHDHRIAIRLATTFSILQAMKVADTTFHAAGATALFTHHPFERRFRDIHAVSQQVQGRSEHLETVGQAMFGLEHEQQWL
ncbi:MAG TPA: acyl-CoA dehydrogenase family protein [Chloroflexota bacterium]|nr:acyl-CoA dehydrogenase family protein [Chloroflexota bacterium]